MAEEYQLLDIPLSEIEVGKRFRKEYHDLESLADSIREKGVITPIAVMKREGKRFLLLAGGRRFTAAAMVELPVIPAKVYPELDDLSRREIELIENAQREDMSYAEGAELTAEIHRLEEEKHGVGTRGPGEGATLTKTAHLLGKSRTLIKDELDLADAFQEMPELRDKRNKTEAIGAMRKAKEDIVRRELARRLESTAHKDDRDLARRKLMNAYVVGDFFEKVKDIPAEQFHLAEVDPPYAIDPKRTKRQNHPQNTFDYNEVAADDYAEFLRATFTECFRVLKNNAWLLCWFAPDPWWEVVRKAIQTAGFTLYAVPLIWYKSDSVSQKNQPAKRMANNWEACFYAFKGDPTLVRQGRTNVFPYAKVAQADKIHPTERPVELMEAILRTFLNPGSRVIVPFAGSGATLLAADNCKLEVVGFDLTSLCKDRYVVKVAEQESGRYKSYR
jgi:ParB/RepB/Spo0J family partition protein